MGYTRGIEVQNQYQGDGIDIVLVVVINHLYPIPKFYRQRSSQKQRNDKQKYITNTIWLVNIGDTKMFAKLGFWIEIRYSIGIAKQFLSSIVLGIVLVYIPW